MAILLRLFAFFAAVFGLTLLAVGLAQEVIMFDPSTWFASSEAVIIAAGLITPWITKVITALGKDWFHTDGKATQWLSLGVAVIIGGVGGYLSLGYFADVSGFMGALQAAFIVAVAFLGSNGMAKSERQVAKSAAHHIGEEVEEHTAIALKKAAQE